MDEKATASVSSIVHVIYRLADRMEGPMQIFKQSPYMRLADCIPPANQDAVLTLRFLRSPV